MMDATPEVIVNIDESNAAQYLIEESMQRPVVIDFWADWCEPCKVLMPLLEKLATEYAGAFLLAKVNADDQQMIAQQFGVRSLPTVMVMRDGQPVDGFAGAQSEQAVREMLEKHLPSPYEAALVEANTMLEAGDAVGAVSILRGAYEESGRRHDIAMTLVHALIEARRLDDAQVLLDAVPMADQDPLYDQLLAQLTLAREAARSPELVALEEQLEKISICWSK
jgi:putative thioredoxin